MGTIRKKVTPAVLAANRANSTASTGPSGSGKEQSKRNAVKTGKYAQRPDPVELMLKDHTEEEEAEREQLRTGSVRSYQPPDDFAREQAEELGDLRFELRRLERAKEVLLARERELVALEQRHRALHLKAKGAENASINEIYRRGLASQEDSPGKFREMLEVLESLVRQEWAPRDAHRSLDRLYGDSWRGVRLNRALDRAEESASDEDHEQAQRDFKLEVEREIEHAREELAICELEQGPLSKAAEAARLLEAMGSRKWSWSRQHETFLRRSIDRKVQVLSDLRREALRAERWATEVADGRSAPGRKSSGSGGGRPAGGGPSAAAVPVDDTQDDEASSAPPGSTGAGAKFAADEAPEAKSQSEISRGAGRHGGARNDRIEAECCIQQLTLEPGARNDRLDAGKAIRQVAAELGAGTGGLGDDSRTRRSVSAGMVRNDGRNQGTKPLSPLVSAEPWREEPWVIDSRDLPQPLAAVEPPDCPRETPWSPVSRS